MAALQDVRLLPRIAGLMVIVIVAFVIALILPNSDQTHDQRRGSSFQSIEESQMGRTTVLSYVACSTIEEVNRWTRLRDDRTAAMLYFFDHKCTFIKSGTKVFVEDHALSVVCLRPPGTPNCVWTYDAVLTGGTGNPR